METKEKKSYGFVQDSGPGVKRGGKESLLLVNNYLF